MLQNLSRFYGFALAGSDGAIGHVKDFLFDDMAWVIRYLVVDASALLPGRLVLLPPHALGRWDYAAKSLPVKLTLQRIEDGPSIEAHKPVSRQYEIDCQRYYHWPAYWDRGVNGGLSGLQGALQPSAKAGQSGLPRRAGDNERLHSARAVTGYQIHAVDGVLGSVNGFMMDEKSWAIRELVVETGHWYAGKEILISADNLERISHDGSQVFVSLSKANLQHTAKNDLAKTGL